ncbi:hypothetical protein [Phenylobacterium kunshanense]|uniref:Uncharacterized protein n=1 Tax=Phenylobacterium kunshanense TaxID=1445034 RepID=A0A328BKV0_9CAUL|nr:hypothetical protein [Phenylobacterium kunshanense]RAK66574.1 hypothetical protein DJ019_10075 [Phenylobacterium kunshanense]
MSLRHTYELYLESDEGARTFEALTCAGEIDLLSQMRKILAERGLKSIEAWRLGRQVLVLDR